MSLVFILVKEKKKKITSSKKMSLEWFNSAMFMLSTNESNANHAMDAKIMSKY